MKKIVIFRVFQIDAEEAIHSFLPSMLHTNQEMSHFVIDAGFPISIELNSFSGTNHAYEVQKSQVHNSRFFISHLITRFHSLEILEKVLDSKLYL